MPERIIRAVNVTFEGEDGKLVHAVQGDVLDIPQAAIDTLEPQRALVPEGWDSFAAFHEANLDAYRAGRGDTEAAARALNLAASGGQGGVIDISAPAGNNPFVETLQNDAPTAEETVALAGGDPVKAAQVLEAESIVTGGEPRKTVEEPLQKIIAGS